MCNFFTPQPWRAAACGVKTQCLRVELEYSSFSVEGQPDLTLVVYSPSGEEDADKIRLLLQQKR